MQKKTKKTIRKIKQTQKAINNLLKQFTKNFKSMKKKIKYIWLCLGALICTLQSCNVSRTITNESQYLQRGDTSVIIQTKTIETYNADKKF